MRWILNCFATIVLVTLDIAYNDGRFVNVGGFHLASML